MFGLCLRNGATVSENEHELLGVLQWIGTSLEKLVDIQMTSLPAEEAGFLDFVHNTKNIFMSDLTQDQLDALVREFRELESPNEEE